MSEQRVGRYKECREILHRFYPGGDWPQGLLPELWKAIGRAELRGFDECLAYFDGRKVVPPELAEHGTEVPQ
jgi:hypothetical protein